MADRFRGPFGRLLRVTRVARIGNLVLHSGSRRDELKRMRPNKSVWRPFCLDLWHVARNALAAGAVFLVMCVFFERGGTRPIG